MDQTIRDTFGHICSKCLHSVWSLGGCSKVKQKMNPPVKSPEKQHNLLFSLFPILTHLEQLMFGIDHSVCSICEPSLRCMIAYICSPYNFMLVLMLMHILRFAILSVKCEHKLLSQMHVSTGAHARWLRSHWRHCHLGSLADCRLFLPLLKPV